MFMSITWNFISKLQIVLELNSCTKKYFIGMRNTLRACNGEKHFGQMGFKCLYSVQINKCTLRRDTVLLGCRFPTY